MHCLGLCLSLIFARLRIFSLRFLRVIPSISAWLGLIALLILVLSCPLSVLLLVLCLYGTASVLLHVGLN